MSKPRIQVEMRKKENILINNYKNIIKFFFIITIIIIILNVIVFLGLAVFNQDYNWFIFSIQNWLIISSVILGIIIFFEVIIYIYFSTFRNKRINLEKIKPEYIDGKRIHVYTYPNDSDSGIFSKTYVLIDNDNVLRLRTLLIPPEDLW